MPSEPAVADAEVAHDLEPWVPGLGYAASTDPIGVDEHVAAVEYGLEALRERIATDGHRRPPVAL